jgi:hypothetical protein
MGTSVRRRIHKWFAAGGGFWLCALGCTDSRTSILVEGVLALEAPECVASPDPSAIHIGRGVMDVAFRLDYFAWLLIGNQLTPRGDKEQLRPESADFTLRGAEVELLDSQLEALDVEQAAFSVPISGFIFPTSSETPGFGVALTTLIPQTVGEELRSELEGTTDIRTIIASVSVFGETLGGIDIDSSRFMFPIDICHGCLVTFPLAALLPDNEGPACTVPGDEMDPPCRIGQDDAIDCRLCSASLEICLRP